MLLELLVENYAVIERLRVTFHRGFNVLTGETGSGKSIVVDALGLLLGARATGDMLRTGMDRARISGIFEAPPPAAALLEAAGIDVEEGEIVIEREIQSGGKSRAFVANRPGTVALLRELAPHLADIHGQHDQQQLFSAEAQLDILDAFAGIRSLREETGILFQRWRTTAKALDELERNEKESLRLLDLWTFQRNEIESARLKPAEDVELEKERRVLQNVSKLLESASTAYAALYDAADSAHVQVSLARRRLEDLGRIDESLTGLLEALSPAQVAVDEVAGELRGYLGRLEADPQRLEAVETRLATIDKLKRKYGASVEEIQVFAVDVSQKIQSTESSVERKAVIEKEREELAQQYQTLSEKLSAQREQAAAQLGKRVQSELKSLAMERTVFEVRMGRGDWSATGVDRALFLVSPNAGEEPRSLDKVASGGELSRIALALKTCVSGQGRADTLRTLVFDEVDAGIGGAAAEMVGRRLKQLAGANQVLCVTHLAQIAGFADHHYMVEKKEAKGRTVATLEELQGEARTREIGRMLSGQRLTPEALKHAEQLIRLSAAEKK